MSNDIVARLRESDGGYFMRKMFAEAADEIERLRQLSGNSGQLRGCARDQTTTQFCAEAVALHAEVERLREALREIAANRNSEPYSAEYADDILKGKA